MVNVAINGFGRIGRNILRAIMEQGRDDIQVTAINDLADPATSAHLLQYDSVHGRYPGEVRLDGDMMDLGRGPIKVTAERDPSKLSWDGVDVALECTGVFRSREKASAYLEAGGKEGFDIGAGQR